MTVAAGFAWSASKECLIAILNSLKKINHKNIKSLLIFSCQDLAAGLNRVHHVMPILALMSKYRTSFFRKKSTEFLYVVNF